MGEVFQIFLLGLTGTKHTVDVANSEEAFGKTTVQKFKEMVASKIDKEANLKNLGPDDIRLVFGTKQLEENGTFEEYNVIPKSTVFMVLKLPGGWHLSAYFPTQTGMN